MSSCALGSPLCSLQVSPAQPIVKHTSSPVPKPSRLSDVQLHLSDGWTHSKLIWCWTRFLMPPCWYIQCTLTYLLARSETSPYYEKRVSKHKVPFHRTFTKSMKKSSQPHPDIVFSSLLSLLFPQASTRGTILTHNPQPCTRTRRQGQHHITSQAFCNNREGGKEKFLASQKKNHVPANRTARPIYLSLSPNKKYQSVHNPSLFTNDTVSAANYACYLVPQRSFTLSTIVQRYSFKMWMMGRRGTKWRSFLDSGDSKIFDHSV